MYETGRRTVKFDKFCPMCKNYLKPENEYPCCECLCHSTNYHSRKPVKFKEKEK